MTNSQIPDFKVIYLQELLSNADDFPWNDLSQRIVNPDSVRLIINCQGVNPNQLDLNQRYNLFYLPQQQNWGFADYQRVFQNITDEMADFIDKVINKEIIIKKPSDITQEIPNRGDSSQSDTQPPPPSPDDPSPGTIIRSRYEIIRKLSEGSFGKTYLAKDRDIPGDPNCVVKLLKPSVSQEGTISKAKRLFEQEAAILHKLNHNCIPKLFAYSTENQRFYLVQEYIEGDTLDRIIPGSQPWTQQQVKQLLEDILDPLAYLHQQNIIHRDIKPANLIRRQQDQKIVLIDFGAIKQVTQQANQPGTVIGSQGYMATEQYEGNSKLASDLYAVGMVAIQAATGCRLNQLGRTPHGLSWKDKAINLNSQLKEFINKLTEWNYQDRYPSAQEALEALEALKSLPEPSPPPPPPPPKPRKSPITKIILAISSVIALAGIGLGVKSIPYFTKPKLSVDTIKIGHLWYPDDYLDLESHLEEGLVPANYGDFLRGKKINVIIEGDRSLSYQEARNRIAKRQWDIAFTLSPINSIWAIDHDYTYLAAMFPGSTHYEGGIFVRRDSPIQSIDDLGPTTIIALGGFNSASSFYMPAYKLYGKTVSVNTGNRGPDIVNKIKQGDVDAGAAAIGDSIRKDDPELRIIHVSGAIPGSGVYLSPDLSRSDRQSLTQVMLNASEDIKEKANYGGDSPEPDYTEFRKVMARVDEILICSDFSKNPVNFFCPDDLTISEIRARVNGASFKDNQYLLRVVGGDNQIYNVTLDPDLFQSIVGSDKLTDIHNKNLVITIPGEPTQTETGLHIPITQAQQLQILD